MKQSEKIPIFSKRRWGIFLGLMTGLLTKGFFAGQLSQQSPRQ